MNAPLKPPAIEEVLASACVGISNLKANPSAVIAEAQVRQVAILNRNKPVAYVVSPQTWEYLCQLHEDAQDAQLARERLASGEQGIPVTLNELLD